MLCAEVLIHGCDVAEADMIRVIVERDIPLVLAELLPSAQS
jgi:hypothetical protein